MSKWVLCLLLAWSLVLAKEAMNIYSGMTASVSIIYHLAFYFLLYAPRLLSRERTCLGLRKTLSAKSIDSAFVEMIDFKAKVKSFTSEVAHGASAYLRFL